MSPSAEEWLHHRLKRVHELEQRVETLETALRYIRSTSCDAMIIQTAHRALYGDLQKAGACVADATDESKG